jgi:drug/metabolite transporter (DMT)-like permease
MQIGTVAPLWSVAYRFGLAAIILLLFCFITKRSLRFNIRTHLIIIAQGCLLFSGNYLLFYLSTPYMITGLMAVVYATLVMMNMIHSRLFFRTAITAQVLIGCVLGLFGLCLVFWSEIKALHINASHLHYLLLGVGMSLLATLLASWGNMIATYHQRKQLPVVETNALGMLYGAIALIIVAFFMDEKPSFDWHMNYFSALLYLSIFGSVLAFGAYVTLLKKIGPTRAAYSFVVIPILALTVSTFLEGFKWLPSTVMGVILIMAGNVLVLYKAKKNNKITQTA